MKTLIQAPAPNGWAHRRTAIGRLALAMATVLAVLAMAGPSRADDDWDHWQKHRGQGWGQYKHYPAYVYAPPPRYYYPPPAVIFAPPPPRYYYPPPAVIYAPPPPAYYYPEPGLKVVIPIQID